METFGLLKFKIGPDTFTRQVQLIGVNPEDRAKTGDFAEFLIDDHGRRIAPSFAVTDEMRRNSRAGQILREAQGDPDDPFNMVVQEQLNAEVPDNGMIIGFALGTIHRGGRDEYIITPGTKVGLMYPKSGKSKEPGFDEYTVVGYIKSGMSEYDSTQVYVPLAHFQQARALMDEQHRGAVNQIQIKDKPGANLDRVARQVQTTLDQMRPWHFRVATWEQKQGPLLSAVAIEQNILNMLLFFIIAVAGFGILAIFSMIVVEKTRDIGVMKALGASTAGVRGIFLGYGLLLGVVGCGVGLAGGLLFVKYINVIEKGLSVVVGHRVFDDSIYYFSEIPTLVEPATVAQCARTLLIAAAARPGLAHARRACTRSARCGSSEIGAEGTSWGGMLHVFVGMLANPSAKAHAQRRGHATRSNLVFMWYNLLPGGSFHVQPSLGGWFAEKLHQGENRDPRSPGN